MRNREDIESYLMRSGLPIQEVEPNLWVVRDGSNGENIVINLADPLVVFRVKVMDLAGVQNREMLFERLLSSNAQEMIHGSYGIANDAIVLTCSLRLENLDYNEFQGTIDDFSMALSNHYETLASFRKSA